MIDIINYMVNHFEFSLLIAIIIFNIIERIIEKTKKEGKQKLFEIIFDSIVEVSYEQLSNKEKKDKVIDLIYNKYPRSREISKNEIDYMIEKIYKLRVKPKLQEDSNGHIS